MNLQRYDIIEAELKYTSGSIQSKRRPYIIVGNIIGTNHSDVVIIMPLTHVIKKRNLPTHECIDAETETGLKTYSMILGEQPQTIAKEEVIEKLGKVNNQRYKNLVNKVCYNTFFYGEKINWNEVLI